MDFVFDILEVKSLKSENKELAKKLAAAEEELKNGAAGQCYGYMQNISKIRKIMDFLS